MRILSLIVVTLLFSIAAFGQSNRAELAVAENFTAVSPDGSKFELSSLKGKVVVLTFWSTKCPICEAEIPNLNQLAGQFKGADVVFAAPTANGEAMVNRFLKDNPFNFIILPNSIDAVMKYAEKDGDGNLSMGFPTHFLIDQEGRIELKTSGFGKTETLSAGIKSLLLVPGNKTTGRAQ